MARARPLLQVVCWLVLCSCEWCIKACTKRMTAQAAGIDRCTADARAIAGSLAALSTTTSLERIACLAGCLQVNAEGVFRYAYIPWFAQALQVLALSGVHGVAVDVWVSDLTMHPLQCVHTRSAARATLQQQLQKRWRPQPNRGSCCCLRAGPDAQQGPGSSSASIHSTAAVDVQVVQRGWGLQQCWCFVCLHAFCSCTQCWP
jgi:hypothetical protein